MATTQSQTNEDITSHPIMNIQSTNYRVHDDVDAYLEGFSMLIVSLQNLVLSTAMFRSFAVPLTWLKLVGSTAIYSKTMQIVTFQLTNGKKLRLSKKLFSQILNIPNVEPFSKVNNAQIIHMFNEMVHQPVLTKISDFISLAYPVFGTLCLESIFVV